MRIISPSMLSADFGNLQRDTEMINRSAAEWIHIDVMDGLFVPNISFGFPVLKSICQHTSKFVDTHLMIVDPERYVERFVQEGSDSVTFHLEASQEPQKCIELIRKAGAKVGISIKPSTAVESLREFISQVDMVLVMSVEPGFGGQSFIEGSLERVRAVRALAKEMGSQILIQVDGGIGAENAGEIFAAGADVLVAGNSIFKAQDPESEISKILNS